MTNTAAVLWDEVRTVIADVRAKHLTPSQANSMIRAYGVLIDLAKLRLEEGELDIQRRRLELDVEERTELKARMAELEDTLKRQEERRLGRGYS